MWPITDDIIRATVIEDDMTNNIQILYRFG